MQDDVCATYAYLTAMKLGLEPLMMGYGAVGVTRGGCGGVPKVAESYPYCYEGAPVDYREYGIGKADPELIVINHGANDGGAKDEDYLAGYAEFLDLVRKMHPTSVVVILAPFCGRFDNQLSAFVPEYNKKTGADIKFVATAGWIPAEPLHPLRGGHEIIAEKLTAELSKIDF